jgi:hypothetical protein
LIAIGCISQLLGDLVWFYYEVVRGINAGRR